MTRRERLMKTLRGEPVDRPAVNFYELNGLDQNPADHDPFNIFSHPSWKPLLELTTFKSDRIVIRGVPFRDEPPSEPVDVTTRVTRDENGCRIVATTIQTKTRTLTSRTLHDPDVATVWTTEHLLKDVDDLKAYLDIPAPAFGGIPDTRGVLTTEEALGETGIVMIDTADPLCLAAALFDMGTYTVIAMTEPELFRKLLDRFAATLLPRTDMIAKALPGRLWRIYGPEYASPPYLPPALFKDYVVDYDRQMIQSIQKYGGFARIHSHGRLHGILDTIASMHPAGLDPIEPPPQGDVALSYVRERYGRNMVLFGNLEISDIENLPVEEFANKVRTALAEGTSGTGRGFILMPSSCPYGRVLPEKTLRNYEKIIEMIERL